MSRILRLLLLAAVSVTIFISCNQDPTSVGSSIIPSKDKIGFAQVDSYTGDYKQTSSSYTLKPKLGGGTYVLLGNLPYMQANILFRWDFYPLDSIKTAIKNGKLTVDGATLHIRPRYTIGNTTSGFDFTVRQVQSPWSASGFDRDSINSLVIDNNNIKTGLSVDSVYRCALNTSTVYKWLKYVTDSTSSARCYGTVLTPTSGTTKIQGFRAIDLLSSTADTSETYMKIAITHTSPTTGVTGIKDTLTIYPAQDIYYIQNYTDPPKNGDIIVEGSYATDGKVFIDFPAIPKNVIVNQAFLTLTVDTLNTTDGSLKSDTMYVHTLGDSTKNTLSSDSLVYAIMYRSGNTYKANVSWMIQKWIDKDANYPNLGVTLSLVDLAESAARIAFYGSTNPNKALRPKLTFTYMQKQ